MLKYYKTKGSEIAQIAAIEEGCWVNAVNPTESEMSKLSDELKIDPGFLHTALDAEELSRIDVGNGQTMIVFNVPVAEKQDNTLSFSTVPMSVIITESCVLTVCMRENCVVTEFTQGLLKNVQTNLKTRFVLYLLMRMSVKFLQQLKQIDKISSYIEKQVHGSLKNQEILQLLDLKKSLVYFSTSLKANEITLEKILRGRVIKFAEEDRELLEDILIEVKQAVEVSGVYTSVLTGHMNALSSLISNNMNSVMKLLVAVIIILGIPEVIFNFYGMNLRGIPIVNYWFPILLSAAGAAFAAMLLYKKKMF